MADRNIENLKEISKGYFNLPIKNNPDALEVWTLLYDRQYYHLKDKAYSLFFDGLNQLRIMSTIGDDSELQSTAHKILRISNPRCCGNASACAVVQTAHWASCNTLSVTDPASSLRKFPAP